MFPWVHPTRRPKRHLDRVSRFFQSLRHSVPILYTVAPLPNIAPSYGGSGPMVPWVHPSPQPKWHLDQFSRFVRLATVTDRPTDGQIDRQRYSVCNNRPHLRMQYCDAAYNNKAIVDITFRPSSDALVSHFEHTIRPISRKLVADQLRTGLRLGSSYLDMSR